MERLTLKEYRFIRINVVFCKDDDALIATVNDKLGNMRYAELRPENKHITVSNSGEFPRIKMELIPDINFKFISTDNKKEFTKFLKKSIEEMNKNTLNTYPRNKEGYIILPYRDEYINGIKILFTPKAEDECLNLISDIRPDDKKKYNIKNINKISKNEWLNLTLSENYIIDESIENLMESIQTKSEKSKGVSLNKNAIKAMMSDFRCSLIKRSDQYDRIMFSKGDELDD